MVRQVDDFVGVAHERAGVAGQEELFFADADHERASQPGADDRVGKIAEKDRQAIRPLEHGQRLLRRPAMQLVDGPPSSRVLVEMVGDQVGDDFGVGVAVEDVAQLLQLVAQHGVILDDAVVHDGRLRRCRRRAGAN